MSLVLCCRDATELLTEDAEGKLSGAQKATFAIHLTLCGRCRGYRAQLDTTVDVLHALPRSLRSRDEQTKASDVDAILRRIAIQGAPQAADDD